MLFACFTVVLSGMYCVVFQRYMMYNISVDSSAVSYMKIHLSYSKLYRKEICKNGKIVTLFLLFFLNNYFS